MTGITHASASSGHATRPALAVTAFLAVCLTAANPGAGEPPRTGEPPGDDAVKADTARMQGVWVIERIEANGVSPGEAERRAWVLVVEKNVYNPGTRQKDFEYSFRLDPSRSPKAIDLIPHSGPNRLRTLRGIYELKGDRLTVCRSLDPDIPRPSAFESRPDSGHTLVVWKRRKG